MKSIGDAREKHIQEAFRRVTARLPARVPVSTYRMQFNAGFTFEQARGVLPYLSKLGITDIYSSPYFTAQKGSLHGYDVTDPTTLNPELGGEEAFAEFIRALEEHGMGLIMDIVPNHMSIGASQNAWWNDVLENGQSSPYAGFFDIDWKPVPEKLEDKVILPILGDQYGSVLENQELRLTFEDGAFFVTYYDNTLPVDPCTYDRILTHRMEEFQEKQGEDDPHVIELLSIITALRHLPRPTETDPERVAERLREKEIIKRRLQTLDEESPAFRTFLAENIEKFNGTRHVSESFDLLDELLSAQVYRLSFWQVATEEINYRRFFDINDLAAIRTEDPEVFLVTHRMVLRHVREGKVTGLRVDHPDGLSSPRAYFRRLQEECFAALCAREEGAGKEDPAGEARVRELYASEREVDAVLEQPFYVVGEKILMESESLPYDWPIFGTTGYVFMNSVGGIFVEGANADLLTATYELFTGRRRDFAELLREKKKLIMESSMASEINVLGHWLSRLAEQDRRFRDFTRNSLTHAIVEVIANFPVYRTYIDEAGVSDQDLKYIEQAIGKARRRRKDLSPQVFAFLHDVLILRDVRMDEQTRRRWLEFTMKFQQITGPVMAKGLEDTVFYDYNRLVSLNEVGGNPDRFGTTLEAFHGRNTEMCKRWPTTMVTTSTHDSKRSEDVRARIHVISEFPEEWRALTLQWAEMNQEFKATVEGGLLAPDRNDEYLLYQSLVGAWPMLPMDEEGKKDFTERIKGYMLKAVREGKENTSWINPDPEYEEAVTNFVEAVLGSERFLGSFLRWQRKISTFGIYTSLAQVLLKVASPGVPDFYQGSELWNLTLVDPDNRRPVDYGKAEAMLAELLGRESERQGAGLVRELLSAKEDGRVKLYLTYKALNYRRARRQLFEGGQYIPLRAAGEQEGRVVAFERRLDGSSCIAAVPRFLGGLVGEDQEPLGEVWKDTHIVLEDTGAPARFLNVLTGETVRVVRHRGSRALSVRDAFAHFPAALLEKAF
jgi:(1->4)-alpha-D-glucan 1-alpha-D-glucosylmutase